MKILVIGFLLITSSQLIMASANDDKITHTPYAGFSFSHFKNNIGNYSDTFQKKTRTGITLGWRIKYNISKSLGVETGLGYNSKGGGYKKHALTVQTMEGEKIEYDLIRNFRLEYVELPFLLDINLSRLIMGRSATSFLHISSGVSFGINTGSSVRYNSVSSRSAGGPWVDVSNNFTISKFNYATKKITNFLLEASLHFVSQKDIPGYLIVRYNKSLNDVYSVTMMDGNNFKTKMATITIGYGLKF
ncbi:MAG: outer membrane beta-barrel protein [Flavobacteriales bacterium]|nr:outer membrane beta-barrel protein [Flavobacteriales bacterium]